MVNNYCDCRQGRDSCTCKSALAGPVPSTNVLLNQVEKAQAEMAEWPKAWRDSEGLEPVPPAGGEPEVAAVAYMNVTRPNNRGNVYDLDWYSAAERLPVGEYHLVDEAHVTRLQAKVESERTLRRNVGAALHARSDEVKDLQSELTNALKHFETVVQDNKNLYEELTKAWELLRSVRLNANPALFSPGQVAAIDAFLSHQSAPAAKVGE